MSSSIGSWRLSRQIAGGRAGAADGLARKLARADEDVVLDASGTRINLEKTSLNMSRADFEARRRAGDLAMGGVVVGFVAGMMNPLVTLGVVPLTAGAAVVGVRREAADFKALAAYAKARGAAGFDFTEFEARGVTREEVLERLQTFEGRPGELADALWGR